MIDTKKNIIIFSHEFPPFLGGVGKIGYYLAKLYSEDCDVTVITRKEKIIKKIDKVTFYIVNVLPKIWFFSYAFFYFKNKKIFDKADLIYLNEAAPTIVAGIFFSKKHLSKSIIIAHGLEIEGVLEKKSFLHKLFRIKQNYKYALENSKKLLTLSSAMKEKISSAIPEYSHKIDYCYLGVDTKDFYYEKNSLGNFPYKKYKNKKIIGSCSRIVLGKGYIEMANVIKKILLKDSNYIWLIAGDGSDIQTIKNHIKSLGIEENVQFLGALSFEELRGFYSSIDIFMLLSNYDEVFPLVYIEAQMCGAVAIGRNKGGVVEVIDTKTGLLANSDKEVVDFVLNAKKSEKLDIIEFAQRFDIKNNFNKWREVVES